MARRARVSRRLAVAALVLLPAPLAAQKVRDPDPEELIPKVTADSNDAELRYQLAMAYWRKKKFDDAERTLRQAVRIAPDFAEAYFALAMLPAARGPDWLRARYKSGGRDAMMQLFGEADREYRKAFLLNPLVDLRLLGKADEHGDRLAFRVSGNRVFVLDLWWRPEYAKALNLIQDARYGDAFTKLDGLLRAPKAGTDGANLPDGVIWYHGLVCAHLGRWDEAIHSMAVLTGRAIASEQSDEITAIPLRANEYRYALGTMYFLGGEPDKAIAVFHRALEFDAGLYVAHVQLARIYEAARHWDEAVQERQLAVELNPDDPTLLVDLGGTLAAAGRPADADSVLAAAESANPRDARASYLHALAAERAGRGAEAHDAFTRFLAIAPSSLAEQITEAKRHLAAAP